jgi:hypothetical protein
MGLTMPERFVANSGLCFDWIRLRAVGGWSGAIPCLCDTHGAPTVRLGPAAYVISSGKDCRLLSTYLGPRKDWACSAKQHLRNGASAQSLVVPLPIL